MAKLVQRPLGYPRLERVQRGCRYTAQAAPEDAYQMCIAQLHNLSKTTTAGLLQVFKINTLAACWILRDIEQHQPVKRFAAFRKINSTRYFTDGIATTLTQNYRDTVLSRYTLNGYLYNGLSVTLASMVSGYLQKTADAQKRGLSVQFQQSADFVVETGKHCGRKLGSLGRKTIFGYAFLSPKREQCTEALQHITVLLDERDDDLEKAKQAESYRMSFGPRRNKPLGTMLDRTLKRLKAIAERHLADMADYDALRAQAQQYLRFTPPGFPHIKSDGLSPERQRQLHRVYVQALDEFGALPQLDDDFLEHNLTDDERTLFRQLQQRAYADAQIPDYVALRWNRADAVTRHRECGLVYDPKRKRYLFLAYLFASDSRHRRPLQVNGQLFDVNNPTTALETSRRSTSARLFELEFARHQQKILDQAREDAVRWKGPKSQSSGSVRAATLHAHYAPERQQWWFEVHLSIGIKPTHIEEPQHIVGVHIDPITGWYVSVAKLDGTVVSYFALDEACIAELLGNKRPVEQSHISSEKRTTKERQHRIADAVVAVCQRYQGQLGVENIGYLAQQGKATQGIAKARSSRAITELIPYKLARLNLPPLLDVNGIAPKRDCGACGVRHESPQIEGSCFVCVTCSYPSSRHENTTREVVRRVLWKLAQKQAPKSKEPALVAAG